ncbi:unnamed protein product [Symbiodinium natans]|uniref:Aquaporin n=1 Tax=Symbiodinium natans TaxID=878477 RepID=A0A812UKL0_9DINO|nr:unnamed protein product [Symbiodinium natans]
MKLPQNVSLVACLAEFVGMALFVMIGCGSAMGIKGSDSTGSMIPGWVLMVALVFGLSITTLAYSIGHYSGGHLNCAVTLGLVLTGNCGLLQGICNVASQMLGSVLGAAILCAIFPPELDMTTTLGANSVGPKWYWWNALIGEIMGTFLLVFVVHQTACNPKSAMNRSQACIAIGIAVFMAHCVLIPIDGCSINPTRSFGPALLALSRASRASPADEGPGYWRSMWIFWVGPLLGACLAAGVYKLMLQLETAGREAAKEATEMPEEDSEEAAEMPEKDSDPEVALPTRL